MARMFQSGFELNSVLTAGDWAANSNTPTIVTTAARSGTYHLRIVTLSSGAAKGLRVNVTSAGSTTAVLFARMYLRVITLPGATGSTVMSLSTRGGFTTPLAYATLRSDGKIDLNDEDGNIGTSTTALSADGTYHRIELKYDASGAGGSHVVELKIDGTVEVTASNRNLAGSGASFNVGGNLNAEANTTGEWYIDDCACNDNSGSFQNSYPGSGKIVMCFVTGDGDTTNRGTQGTHWETGPTPSQTGYQMVDDTTPDDATTYIEYTAAGTAAPTNVFLCTFDTPASKGVGASDTINVAAVRMRHGVIGGVTSGRDVVSVLKSGSSYVESSTIQPSGGAWNWDNNSTGFNAWGRCVTYQDPATSTAWTLTGLTNANIGGRPHTDVTPPPSFSMFALDLEYDPAGATTLTPGVGAATIAGPVMQIANYASNQIVIQKA